MAERAGSREVTQRECGLCDFSGPDTEFIAFGRYGEGDLILVHRDDATEDMRLICVGCASEMGRTDSRTIAAAIRLLLLREYLKRTPGVVF
jgi:hypothetical protein